VNSINCEPNRSIDGYCPTSRGNLGDALASLFLAWVHRFFGGDRVSNHEAGASVSALNALPIAPMPARNAQRVYDMLNEARHAG
jgi:hypothetical protein